MSAISDLVHEQKNEAKSNTDKIAVKLLSLLLAGDNINQNNSPEKVSGQYIFNVKKSHIL